ncbi:MAG: hypothetical protein Q4E69_00420 [Bacilli bacterium]|nr:hypothetical protein [Bacilli bacterium]
MEKIPKLYQNKFDKIINNNKNMCIVEERKENINDILKNVYTGLGKYNTKVLIETDSNVYDTSIIYKGKDIIITKENNTIPIKNIKRITIKK